MYGHLVNSGVETSSAVWGAIVIDPGYSQEDSNIIWRIDGVQREVVGLEDACKRLVSFLEGVMKRKESLSIFPRTISEFLEHWLVFRLLFTMDCKQRLLR